LVNILKIHREHPAGLQASYALFPVVIRLDYEDWAPDKRRDVPAKTPYFCVSVVQKSGIRT